MDTGCSLEDLLEAMDTTGLQTYFEAAVQN